MFRILLCIWLACGLLALLGACAQQASSLEMIAIPESIARRSPAPSYRKTITVASVSGGTETSPLGLPKVGNARLEQALTHSLLANDLGSVSDGRFRLDARLGGLQQPSFGGDPTVTATVEYKLVDTLDGSTAYENSIVSSGSANVGDSPLAIYRLKIANERAVRANIDRLIEELYALPNRPVPKPAS